MTFNQLLKEIKKHTWWSEEAPVTYQSVAYQLHSFIEQSKYFHPKYLSIAIFIFKNDFFYEETPEDEKYEVYKFIHKKVKNDKMWLLNSRNDYKKLLKKYYKICHDFEKSKTEINNKELWSSYKNFMDTFLESLKYGAALECVDIFTAYYLEDLVKAESPDLDKKEIGKIIMALSAPPILSFMEEERLDFLEIALDYYNDIDKNLKFKNIKKDLLNKLQEHSENYYWVLNNFRQPKFLDAGYFFKILKDETLGKDKNQIKKEISGLKSKIKKLKKEKQNIYKKYSFSKDLKLHFYILEIMAAWIDERKKNMLITTGYIELYCQEIAKRFDLDIWHVKYYLVDEIGKLLLKNKKIDKKILKKRREFSAYIITKDNHKAKAEIFYGNEAQKIYDTIFPVEEVKEIRGQAASAPVSKIKGKAQVILDTGKQKFKEGNILVTTMTRPDFVPLMRKAKAIITDEGGITCHAAVVSRELGIPCIIGTKFASKVLKSGDKIKIDCQKGLIEKID